MGNHKFRLSDMMPNAWFFKLKDMGRAIHGTTKKKHPLSTSTSSPATFSTSSSHSHPQKTHQPHHYHLHQHHHPVSLSRKSYHFPREISPDDTSHHHLLKDPSRKSSSRRRGGRRRPLISSPKLVTSSVAAGCSCRTKADDPSRESSSSFSSSDQDLKEGTLREVRGDNVLPTESFDKMLSLSSSSRVNSTDEDIVINVDKNSLSTRKSEKAQGFDAFSDFELPPIITRKPAQPDNEKQQISKNEETIAENNNAKTFSRDYKRSPARGFSMNSPGVRLRINSPRIGSRKMQSHGRKSISSSRKSLSDSFAVVKSSLDPQRDFRESMVEMIVENNIKASKDLEDLLACYLSLNSDEYHDLIIKVFKQIWFDLIEL